jgi:hypothetical protein
MRNEWHMVSRKTWREESTGDLQRRWENNIKMECDEAGCQIADWIDLAEGT